MAISGLPLGSLGTKNHLDVGAAERHIEYYMGEGGGFPRVWAVVSFVSPKSLVTCRSIKGALKSDINNLLAGLIHIRMSN